MTEEKVSSFTFSPFHFEAGLARFGVAGAVVVAVATGIVVVSAAGVVGGPLWWPHSEAVGVASFRLQGQEPRI